MNTYYYDDEYRPRMAIKLAATYVLGWIPFALLLGLKGGVNPLLLAFPLFCLFNNFVAFPIHGVAFWIHLIMTCSMVICTALPLIKMKWERFASSAIILVLLYYVLITILAFKLMQH